MESHHLRYPIKPLKPKRRLRLVPLFLVLLVILPLTGYTYAALQKAPPTLVPHVKAINTGESDAISLIWPATGQAAIGSAEEGILARSQAVETPMPTASIAKVITALAVLEKKPVAAGSAGPTITLDQTDVDFYNYYVSIGGSNVPVEQGEQITEVKALEAMMLPSANNMADSMAYWAFGSIDAYVSYANTLVKQWGLTQTKIADASGFSAETVSTPSELVIIGQRVLKNATLSTIVAEKQANIPVAGSITNTNLLLGADGVVGIKTGHTNEAGGCLLFAATYSIGAGHSTTIIGAVQGTPGPSASFSASRDLLGSAKQGFGAVTIAKTGTEVGSYTSAWGKETGVIVAEDVIRYGWKSSKPTSVITLSNQKAPLTAHQKTGSINVKVSGNLYSGELKTQGTLEQPSLIWRLTHYF